MIRTIVLGRKRVRIIAALSAVPFLALGALSATTNAWASSPANGEHKVTICHRTGSEAGGNNKDGYSIITVDVASILGAAGHHSHLQVGNGPIGGDVIPEFTYIDKDGVSTFYPGKNGGDISTCVVSTPSASS